MAFQFRKRTRKKRISIEQSAKNKGIPYIPNGAPREMYTDWKKDTFGKLNKEFKRQGIKPPKQDRARRGLWKFLDKYEK